jgi:lipopolysaccharide transport system permease protein
MTKTEDSPTLASHPVGLLPTAAPVGSSHAALADSFQLVIRPRPGWIAIDWKELFACRELLWFLVWRDVTVRYKQTVLGSAWAVINPLTMMLIFTFIFGRFGRLPSQDFPPYPVFVFAGLIPWTLFSQGFAQAALSLASQQQLLTKVYFPRLFVPTAAALVFVVDLIISLGIYVPNLAYYRFVPSWTVILLPLLILLTLIATLSVGLILSALTVFYRDFRHVVPFLSQIFLYFTPVIYPASTFHTPWYRWVLSLNPMFGIVSAYHSAILGIPWDFPCVLISTVVAFVMCVFGAFYFRRTERLFADFA